jgi:hypothetical protein
MSVRIPPRFLVLASALAVLVFGAGCSKHATRDFVSPFHMAQTNELIVAVSAANTPGDYLAQTLPISSGAAPSAASSDTFVAGSATQFLVSIPDSATALDIGVVNVMGYFRVPLTGTVARYAAARRMKLASAGVTLEPAGTHSTPGSTDYNVLITPVATIQKLDLQFAAEYPHSRSGVALRTIYSSYRASGSGQLQVSLSWFADVDLDLHVESPTGTDIYYANREPSGVGGTLDLDSNPACAFDGVDNENISWGANVPAQGTYTVRVDLWSACAATDSIPFVVTVKRCGHVTAYTGKFAPGEADHGSAGSGRVITTVNFTGCSAPQAVARPWAAPFKPVAVR